MYNRYIPQSDGSFRRSSVPEPEAPPQNTNHNENPRRQEPRPAVPPEKPSCSQHAETGRRNPPPPHNPYSGPNNCKKEPHGDSVGSFLKGLLPQNFDTEDLIVVLLLLLISGNCSSDQNLALMTLGIYLFL